MNCRFKNFENVRNAFRFIRTVNNNKNLLKVNILNCYVGTVKIHLSEPTDLQQENKKTFLIKIIILSNSGKHSKKIPHLNQIQELY